MKVVFLLQDTRALYGAEQATVRLVAGLVAAGVAVRALLLRETRLGPGTSVLAEALRGLVPVEEIPVAGRFSRAALGRIRECMAREQADLLHSTGYKADWHALLASRRGALFPIVSTVHGWLFRWEWKERLFQWLNLRALRGFSRVIVLSGFYERHLRRHGLTPLQIARIPTGIRAEEIAARSEAVRLWDSPGEVFTFGMLGRLSEEKDPFLLLSAVRLLKNEGLRVRVLFAGEGVLKDALRERAAAEGLTDAVEMPGYMTAEDFFTRVNALVMCSRIENLPYSILEAMAWCRPAVATRVGGIPELVDDRRTGFLFSPGCADELAACLKKFVQRPDLAEVMGSAGRDKLEREFPLAATAGHHADLYAVLAG